MHVIWVKSLVNIEHSSDTHVQKNCHIAIWQWKLENNRMPDSTLHIFEWVDSKTSQDHNMRESIPWIEASDES